ncbi:LysM peptidoglycan-binding domain-containing M23 family metallopeptidase [Candidatus Nucleicultrix amoebiphila]|jgi:murein DD-endopeptidase MepM/ murein hydrolase activator NlpD|uniref:LysM domain-containing protein n=1 Tax=Candidatus Nucleicultrix amoebiphila FS5 TaxID=1414854 RepID=A0A1W6N4B7_9PROT|nr:LysM peptidoglycan-binding domain-containing M23 family metallopeptidase [Candidatus Nucleicultrix amoebiphila]ARN84694.1 hypothetical protein GQ61_04540 [Candidatus Nucleicultrix amoebiphila FS5]
MKSWLYISFVILLSACSERVGPPAHFSYGTGTAAPAMNRMMVIVQQGETLTQIAQKYHVSTRDLIILNHIPSPYSVRPGQQLLVPKVQHLATLSKPSTAPVVSSHPLSPVPSVITPQPLKTAEPSVPQKTEEEWEDVETLDQKNPDKSTSNIKDQDLKPAKKNLKEAKKKEKHDSKKKEKTSSFNEAEEEDPFESLRGEEINQELSSFRKKKNKVEKKSVTETQEPLLQKNKTHSKSKKTEEPRVEEQTPQEESVNEEAPLSETTQESGAETNDAATEKESTEPKLFNFSWPLESTGSILIQFNQSTEGAKNDGINIKASRGTKILAIEDGVIEYSANEVRGFGNIILINHGGGWKSAYCHADKVLIKQGDRVTKGQTIATVGSSGFVNTPQLHFELRKNAKPHDPLKYLKQS